MLTLSATLVVPAFLFTLWNILFSLNLIFSSHLKHRFVRLLRAIYIVSFHVFYAFIYVMISFAQVPMFCIPKNILPPGSDLIAIVTEYASMLSSSSLPNLIYSVKSFSYLNFQVEHILTYSLCADILILEKFNFSPPVLGLILFNWHVWWTGIHLHSP